jgi:MYXO-CTERM domain-containing protein
MKIRMGLIASTAIVFLASAAVGWGGTIAINNPSFENPSCGSQTTTSLACGAPTGWTQDGNDLAAAFLPASTDVLQAFDGSQYAYTNGGASLDQVLSTTIQANADYELTIWVANRTNPNMTGFCKLCTFDPQVQLVSATTDTILGTASGTTPSVGNNWSEWTLFYDAPASGTPIGENLEIILSSGANQGDYDLVGLTSNVPEPSTFLFAGVGLLGLGFAARRRRLAR